MAHGLDTVPKRAATAVGCKADGKTGIGSRRIFAPHFKLQVLDSYRGDADCKGNQRATARKYGIHRRQIQKWLQVEGNLRNSVRARPDEARQRGGDRVPALPAAPLDCSVRRPSAPDAAPMDLSLKRPPRAPPGAPAPPSPRPHRPQSPPSLARPHPDVWDLSKRKRGPDSLTCPPKPPVKLFKPYLDDVFDTSTSSDEAFRAPPKTSPSNNPQCCCLATTSPQPPNCDYYYTSNNNVVYCDIKGEFPAQNGAYTLHELQPKSYFYPTSPGPFQQSPHHLGVDYETGASCAEIGDNAGWSHVGYPLKQRHSYSVDFKLSAIECYYRDSVCKGNQRAVASKYQIHRRQVQKWLKQEDELRQKNTSGGSSPENDKLQEIAR